MDLLPAFLLEHGIPGAVILVLGWACWNRQKRVDEVLDARIEDARHWAEKSTSALSESKNAMDRLTDVILSGRGNGS